MTGALTKFYASVRDKQYFFCPGTRVSRACVLCDGTKYAGTRHEALTTHYNLYHSSSLYPGPQDIPLYHWWDTKCIGIPRPSTLGLIRLY
eukprot:3821988-Rhodomonas_salina.1